MNSMHKDCIFCKIAKGELPSYKIYEDDKFLAFLDIFPIGEGYTLVIPKKHYRWVWDVENIGEYFEVCKKIVKHFQKVTGKEGVYSMILGEEVEHAHVRIFADLSGEFINKIGNMHDDMKYKLEHDDAEKILRKYKVP